MRRTRRLATVTQPETGTVPYTWNADGTLLRKTDARGQKVEYAYDTLKRPTSRIAKKANNMTDACAVTEYSCDSDPYETGYSQNAQGRTTAVRHGRNGPDLVGDFVEMYSYHTAGAVTGKKLKNFYGSKTGTYATTYGNDNEGRDTAYTYDSMGRSYARPGLVGATEYNAADQPTKITYKVAEPNNAYIERFSYNTLGETVQQHFHDGSAFPSEQAGFDYTYVGGANNGWIAQFKDRITRRP